MTLDLLRENIEREIQITQNIIANYNKYSSSSDKEAVDKVINQSIDQIRIINSAIPNLVNNISFYKTLKTDQQKSNLVTVKSVSGRDETNIAINKQDQGKYASLNNNSAESNAIKNYAGFIRLSNNLFRSVSTKMISQGSFAKMKIDLIKGTSPFLINIYVSMMFFSIFLSFFIGLFFSVLVVALGLIGILNGFLILVAVPFIVFLLFYTYPSSRRKSLEKEINQELPFLTIYMSAIATSGVEPSKLFNLLANSKDYPATRRELKKLTTYLNFYGYDLVTALKLVSKNGPSERLGQLFEGLSTTISTGGELTQFLKKHSETLLFDYRLEREKYTHTAETFMNIYISVVIAAPMIMMILFVLMSVAGGGVSINPLYVSILTVFIIALVNMGFLVLLNSKQPKF